MTQEDLDVPQQDAQGLQDKVEESFNPGKEKFKVVTIFTFAVICLILAVGVYINDYGYTDFLPGSEIDDTELLTADKQ